MTYFIKLWSSHGFSKMKKRGCVSSSRDIDRLNKAFQATKYLQNSGTSIYLLTRSAPRYSAKA